MMLVAYKLHYTEKYMAFQDGKLQKRLKKWYVPQQKLQNDDVL